MTEVQLSAPYQPVDPETGELLPWTRVFVAEGVGFGTAELQCGDDGYRAGIKLRFTFPMRRGQIEGFSTVRDSAAESLTMAFNDDEFLTWAVRAAFPLVRH